ncbi:hypothetical protein GGQ84_000728 [Desulfitispora alkaliphila]|uniref:FxLYD domain-containing protein n=1 Tax=Desulfitispora alkaliphila TaxID=622674 RepID=UPI003D2114E3
MLLETDGSYHLVGVLENKSNYKLDLSIWTTAYNEDDVQIDTGVANVYGLEPNGKAEFQGRITNKDMHSYKISRLVIQYEEDSDRFRQSEIDL